MKYTRIQKFAISILMMPLLFLVGMIVLAMIPLLPIAVLIAPDLLKIGEKDADNA